MYYIYSHTIQSYRIYIIHFRPEGPVYVLPCDLLKKSDWERPNKYSFLIASFLSPLLILPYS